MAWMQQDFKGFRRIGTRISARHPNPLLVTVETLVRCRSAVMALLHAFDKVQASSPLVFAPRRRGARVAGHRPFLRERNTRTQAQITPTGSFRQHNHIT